MSKMSRYPRPVKPTHHRRGSARVFGIPTPLLVAIALASLLVVTYLALSIYNGIIERANELVATGVHPDVSAALMAMFLEDVVVPWTPWAALMIAIGTAVNWILRLLKGR